MNHADIIASQAGRGKELYRRSPMPAQRGGRGKKRDAGEMNGTERKYADYLEAERIAGRVAWYAFESLSFRLADRTTYTPDFIVMLADLSITFVEVKGTKKSRQTGKRSAFCEPHNIVKIKLAAEIFPFLFSMVWLDPTQADGWGRKEFG